MQSIKIQEPSERAPILVHLIDVFGFSLISVRWPHVLRNFITPEIFGVIVFSNTNILVQASEVLRPEFSVFVG